MTIREYLPRLADASLGAALASMGACAIQGPRASGKTRTARQLAHDEVMLDLDLEARRIAELDPRALLASHPDRPLLVDEWQLEPRIWDAVRREVDASPEKGQFILTGSTAAPEGALKHTGAGRIATVRMRPMSLFEGRHSSGRVSLGALLKGEDSFDAERCGLRLADYAELTVLGGWPDLIGADTAAASVFAASYLDAIVERDIDLASGGRRDPRKVRRLLAAYAQLTSHAAPLTTVVARAGVEDGQLSPITANTYLDALRRMWVTDDVEPWNITPRSRARLGKLAKRQLADPSLAASLLECGPGRLLSDLTTFGFLFESLATRDVRAYADALRAGVFHFREQSGILEVDLIVENPRDGNWVGIEVKLGGGAVDTAADSLLRLSRTRAATPASALVVLTAGEYAYRREDGVCVVPLGLLGP